MNDRILFDFDTSDIRPDAVRVIDTLGAALAKVSAKDMQVRGHTDAKGSDDHNQALSERRANAVLAALRAVPRRRPTQKALANRSRLRLIRSMGRTIRVDGNSIAGSRSSCARDAGVAGGEGA
ncbi:hypothetical protein LA22_04460 [Xanthomonas oryzae pv. oryzae]|nr:hypothetical protein LA20_03940 [Xanthomonas oryzae pv. oryzae]PNR76761.1 hypothetical protein LA21_04125 [Xanthomonas oryzae pv. oryzae]PNR78119.1 hypothetical protein LA22_04460 [Xanthomonas oryzae pv. oryzae]PNR93415.1 hypothetical protein LA09_02715 [Xanthomonas oryzae pv. oryzae]